MRLIDADALLDTLDCSDRDLWTKYTIDEAPTIDAITVRQYEELQAKNETLKQLVSGEWVDCDAVMVAMGIDFATGLQMFDFSRIAEWNAYPLNGQRITIKFRLKLKDGDGNG